MPVQDILQWRAAARRRPRPGRRRPARGAVRRQHPVALTACWATAMVLLQDVLNCSRRLACVVRAARLRLAFWFERDHRVVDPVWRAGRPAGTERAAAKPSTQPPALLAPIYNEDVAAVFAA